MRAIAALVCALLLPVAAARADDTTGVTDTSIKIGIPGPLTGSMASMGTAAYGVAAIYRYYNEHGGINGRRFDIVLGDDACNEARSVAVVKKLIFEDKVFLINGSICSGPALAARPVIEEAGVPWVISTAVNQGLSSPTVATTFQASQTSRDIGEAMARFVLSKPGVKTVAVIGHTNEWSRGYRDPAEAYLRAHGVTSVTDYTLERGQTDATSQVLRIRQAPPDFIMVLLYEPEQVVFLRDAHKYGLTAPMIGSLGGDFRDTELRLGSREPMRNFYMAMQYAGLPGGPKLQHWHDIIAENLPAGQKISDYSLYGAGSAVAVVSVLRSLGHDVTRERFIAAMNQLHDFDTGIMAGTLSFTPQNHAGAHDLYAIGYDAAGTLSVFRAWDQKVE